LRHKPVTCFLSSHEENAGRIAALATTFPSLKIFPLTIFLFFLTVVAGAAGGIGQPLSLLLKASPLVDHLSLYDVVNTPGVTADLSHISSVATIDGFLPADGGLKKALTGADIVVIPAGIPRE
jgi:hypothetical protein